MDATQLCPSCGQPNPADADACAVCGRLLSRPGASTTPTPPAVPSAGVGAAAGDALPPPPIAPQAAPPESSSESGPPPAGQLPPSALPPPPSALPPPPAAAPPPPPPSGLMMPPVIAPVPYPPPMTGGQKAGGFFGGLGLGLLLAVVIVFGTSIVAGVLSSLGGTAAGLVVFVPIVLFLASIGLMTYFLAKARLRWIGYGLLTALVILPVVGVVACVVILARPFG